jgi:hypothetical protein
MSGGRAVLRWQLSYIQNASEREGFVKGLTDANLISGSH